ncbi:AIG1-type G domain-containing protein, partial [Durusdinium trenchii]
MKYVLSHLTAIMPKSVVDHVVAVLTNAEEEEDVNFDIRSFQEVGINIPRFEWIDNPFCLVQKLLIRDPSLLEQTRERMTKKIRKSFKAMESVGWLAVPSQKFLELNAKREEIEFHLANNLELLVENERLVGDLLHHAQQIRDGGRAEPLTRQAQHWLPLQLCDIQRRQPLCLIVVLFQRGAALRNLQPSVLGPPSVTRWVAMRVEVGTTVDQAEERLRQAVMEAEQRKRECAQQLQESLEEYQRLGLRDAYMRLLKSQKAVVEERLRTSPDDAALSMHLSSVNACLKEVEDAAE